MNMGKESQGKRNLVVGIVVILLLIAVSSYGTFMYGSTSQNIDTILNHNELNAANAGLNAFE